MSIFNKLKKKKKGHVFENVPPNGRGHFLLHFYAAVYRLLYHLQSFSEKGKESPDETFKQYPFLGGYFEEIRRYMPGEITWDGALKWWETEIAVWAEEITQHLPLRALNQKEGITFESITAFMLVGLVEEDSRFGTLFSTMQAPLVFRRPCLELVGRIMIDESRSIDPWLVCGPLVNAGMIDVLNKDAPRSEWNLRVPSILWDAVRGETGEKPAPWCEYYPADNFSTIDTLVFPGEFLEQLNQVPVLIRDGKAGSIVLRGTPGSTRLAVAGSMARAMDRNIIVVEHKKDETDESRELLGPLCSTTGSIPVIIHDLDPGDTVDVPLLKGYTGPHVIITGFEGGLKGKVVEKAVAMNIPLLDAAYRKRCWQEALAGHPVKNLEKISERFHIPGGYIRQAASMAAAHAALEKREVIDTHDVRLACRRLNRQLLDTLAAQLEEEGSWDRLVVNTTTSEKLRELEQRCRYREKLFQNLGPAFGSERNTGVRALFSGTSGTGKTLAAKILAAELEMDLYRVDLAAVINKYIGETEKNLHRVLTRAEELDVILLLDEGDALLGTRTEVKTANDRYANMETDYLLQKLENYQGIVVITTNAEENIDSAFQRRMDVVVSFIPPREQERLRIWQLHLPDDHEVDYGSLEEAAVRCKMTGGQIRNAGLHASLLALDEGERVNRYHLRESVRSEYRKAGAICPLLEPGQKQKRHRGMEAFIGAMASKKTNR